MSARIPPGFAELWIQFNYVGDPENMYVAIGVDLASGETATQAATNAMLVAVTPAIDNMVANAATIGPGHVIWGNDGGDIRIDGTSTPVAGATAGEALPPNCAVLFRKLTAAGGRRGRGRMYVPGIPEASVASVGTLTGAYMTTCQGVGNAIRDDLTALSQVEGLVLFHDSAPFTPTPITSLEPQQRIATQRRRLRP